MYCRRSSDACFRRRQYCIPLGALQLRVFFVTQFAALFCRFVFPCYYTDHRDLLGQSLWGFMFVAFALFVARHPLISSGPYAITLALVSFCHLSHSVFFLFTRSLTLCVSPFWPQAMHRRFISYIPSFGLRCFFMLSHLCTVVLHFLYFVHLYQPPVPAD